MDSVDVRPHLATNPIFGPRKLKLGTFCTNLDSGAAMTTIEGRLRISWPSTLALARMADTMGFEALIPVGRWRGMGGATNFNGAGFEAFSWAAGIGASVAGPAVFATSHITTVHPVMAAKQAATIDHVTGGRFGLNIVTGWNAPELAMFGLELPDHATRYAMATEWLEIVRRLWMEEDEFDFAGRFYQVRGGFLQPKPLQAPHPVVMGAGSSPEGLHFSARYCDVAFLNMVSHDPVECRTRVAAQRKLAREEYGRDIQVWTNCSVVQGETEADAQALFHEYVVAKGNQEAADYFIEANQINAASFSAEDLRTLRQFIVAGYGGFPLIGTAEQIVDKMRVLSDIVGLGGVVLHWARFEHDMAEFQAVTLPLLEQVGLR